MDTMDYQVDQIKIEPQEPKEYLQQFRNETNQYLNNGENVSEIYPYEQPNSELFKNNAVCLPNPMLSPNIKQCEKCGFTGNSMNQADHISNFHQLSDDEIIKTETEILDSNSYDVQVLHIEENVIQFETNQTIHKLNQPNENDNRPMFTPKEESQEQDGDFTSNQDVNIPDHSVILIINDITTISEGAHVETRKSAMIAPLDPTPTNGDIVPITSSSNMSIAAELKYNTYCSSQLTSNNTPDVDEIVKTDTEILDLNSYSGIVPKTSSSSNSNFITTVDAPIFSKLKAKYREKKKLFSCSVCGKGFGGRCNLNRHKIIHSGEKPYKCDQCPKQFTQKANLKSHMCLHSEKRPFVCGICEKGFATKGHLKIHKIKHIEEKQYKCDQCPKQFYYKHGLNHHMNLHTGRKPFSCNICGKDFLTKGNLNSHKTIHNPENPHKCDQCLKPFTCKSTLTQHMHFHSRHKPFSCSLCGNGFFTETDLNRHKTTHSDEKLYTCGQCLKQFTRKTTLTDHLFLHSGKKPFSCSICGKEFLTKGTLTRHKILHSPENPHKCNQCLKQFTCKSSLAQHMYLHTGQKPFSCSVCAKAFVTKTELNRHEATHSGEKPYKCDQCLKQFTRKSILTQHMYLHTGKKPFGCSICGKEFVSKGNLNSHKTIHNRTVVSNQDVVAKNTSTTPIVMKIENGDSVNNI